MALGVCILYTYYGKSGQTGRTGRPLALKRGNGNGVAGRRTWAGCKHLVAPFKYANGYSKNYFIIRQAPTYTHFLEHKLFIFLYFLSTLFSYFSYICTYMCVLCIFILFFFPYCAKDPALSRLFSVMSCLRCHKSKENEKRETGFVTRGNTHK